MATTKLEKRVQRLIIITPLYFLKFDFHTTDEGEDLIELLDKIPIKNIFAIKRKKEYSNLLCFIFKTTKKNSTNMHSDHLMSERYLVAEAESLINKCKNFSMLHGAAISTHQSRKRKPVEQKGEYTAQNILKTDTDQ